MEKSMWSLPTLWADLKRTSDFEARRAAIDQYNASHHTTKRGIAMSPVKYDLAASFANAIVIVHPDGSVELTHSGCEVGQGIHTKVAQTAAYALGLLMAVPGCSGDPSGWAPIPGSGA